MKKALFLAVLGVVVIVGILGGIKFLQIRKMIDQGKQYVAPPETVTAAGVTPASWETSLTSVGTLEAVQGVTITAELAGKVVDIAFEAGAQVKAGDLLLQQDISSENAQIRAAEANLALAKLSLDRARQLLSEKAVAKAGFDNAEVQYKQAQAELDIIQAVIAKKTIRAPFDGRLGLRQVNLGQVIKEGEPIVSLQALDPIFVNFLLPQQQLPLISPGFTVRVTSDALPDTTIEGRITAINPEVDTATRNIKVQATIANTGELLRPGMYVNVALVLPQQRQLLALPATAILYAPYGDSVFVIETKEGRAGDAPKTLRQQFVKLGERRGDFVEITDGLKAGEQVVSTGVFKLRPGQSVIIDNSLAPAFKLHPTPDQS